MARFLNEKPIIGIILDEDSSNGGRFYQTNKGYFRAIEAAGGVAIGLPYAHSSIEYAKQNCAGLLSTGARIKFPKEHYIEGEDSTSPDSDRFEIEKQLIEAFLDMDLPYLGICNGMQMLGMLSGAKLTFQIQAHIEGGIKHDDKTTRHEVIIEPNSKLSAIMQADKIITNSHHSEGILVASPKIQITAKAADNVIEAIERTDKTFAIGVQWHPELLWPKPENASDFGNGEYSKRLFSALIAACNAKFH